jgi:lycopene cyclase domain-containing protein
MSSYMLVLVISGIVPLLASFYPPLGFYKHGRALLASIAIILVAFGLWDIYATWRGHWRFDSASVWKWRVINLPVEEVLFFIVIPFCSIFTWEIVNYFKRTR